MMSRYIYPLRTDSNIYTVASNSWSYHKIGVRFEVARVKVPSAGLYGYSRVAGVAERTVCSRSPHSQVRNFDITCFCLQYLITFQTFPGPNLSDHMFLSVISNDIPDFSCSETLRPHVFVSSIFKNARLFHVRKFFGPVYINLRFDVPPRTNILIFTSLHCLKFDLKVND